MATAAGASCSIQHASLKELQPEYGAGNLRAPFGDKVGVKLLSRVPQDVAGHEILVKIRDIFKILRLFCIATPRKTKHITITNTTRRRGPSFAFLSGDFVGPKSAR